MPTSRPQFTVDGKYSLAKRTGARAACQRVNLVSALCSVTHLRPFFSLEDVCEERTILLAEGESIDGPINKDEHPVSTSVSFPTLLFLTSLLLVLTHDRPKVPCHKSHRSPPLRYPVMQNNSVEVSVFCVIRNAECEKDDDFSEPAGEWAVAGGSISANENSDPDRGI
jgi:hypothetical protein